VQYAMLGPEFTFMAGVGMSDAKTVAGIAAIRDMMIPLIIAGTVVNLLAYSLFYGAAAFAYRALVPVNGQD